MRAKLLVVCAGTILLAGITQVPATAASAGSAIAYPFTGVAQSFVVPPGVSVIAVGAYGAQGAGGNGGAAGGKGAANADSDRQRWLVLG